VSTRVLPLRSIRPHPNNPRFDLGDLTDLTADIRDNGLIEPLVVVPGSFGKRTGECGSCGRVVERHTSGVIGEHLIDGRPCPGGAEPAADDWFVLAGHRRRQAALDAGLDEVLCVTRFDLRAQVDQVAVMMRENTHRRDLTALEEATGYDMLRDLGWSSTRIAQQVKRSKKTIDRRLALMRLPERQRARLMRGTITLADAEALLDLPPERAARALRSVGTTAFRQEVARERLGSDDPDVIAAELRREFLAPFLSGEQRPPRQTWPAVRRATVRALADGLPRRRVAAWVKALGCPVESADPDRALLALAASEADEGVLYGLLDELGYVRSPIEEAAPCA